MGTSRDALRPRIERVRRRRFEGRHRINAIRGDKRVHRRRISGASGPQQRPPPPVACAPPSAARGPPLHLFAAPDQRGAPAEHRRRSDVASARSSAASSLVPRRIDRGLPPHLGERSAHLDRPPPIVGARPSVPRDPPSDPRRIGAAPHSTAAGPTIYRPRISAIPRRIAVYHRRISANLGRISAYHQRTPPLAPPPRRSSSRTRDPRAPPERPRHRPRGGALAARYDRAQLDTDEAGRRFALPRCNGPRAFPWKSSSTPSPLTMTGEPARSVAR